MMPLGTEHQGPIVRRGEMEPRTQAPCGDFQADIEDLSDRLPLDNLGIRRYHLEAGHRAWPFHAHLANEELIVIEQGTGIVRYGDDRLEVSDGDVVGFPASPKGAHQLTNTSDDALIYLCISTMREPDVTLYPDSDKLGVLAGEPPGGDSGDRSFETYLDNSQSLDYWEGECRDEQ